MGSTRHFEIPEGVGTLAISGAEGMPGVNGDYVAVSDPDFRVAYRKKPDIEGAPPPHVYVYYVAPSWCISNFLGQPDLSLDMRCLLSNDDKSAMSPEQVSQKWAVIGSSN